MSERIDLSKEKMRPHAKGPFRDEVRFLKMLIESPKLTGAVSPSGRFLARAMARAVGSVGDGLVVELGPGTGPVTRALIEEGVPAEQLVLVEYEAAFCRLLRERFPHVRVLQGDAYALRRTLAEISGQPIRAIVSSLPLLNQPAARRVSLIEDAFTLMAPDGVFVQFTYGMSSPIPGSAAVGRFSAHATAPIWRNVPPARVWTYRSDPNARAPSPFLAEFCQTAERKGEALVGRAEAAGRLLRARKNKLAAKMGARARDIFGDRRSGN